MTKEDQEFIFLAGKAGFFCKIDTSTLELEEANSMILEHEQDSRAIVYCKDIGKYGTIIVGSQNGQLTIINPQIFDKEFMING